MKRIYIKEKRFLKSFTVLLLIMGSIVILVASAIYQMSVTTLKQEVQNMIQNTANEMKARMEESLRTCNVIASRILLDERVRLYYTHEAPDELIQDYYNEISGIMNYANGQYIDSVLVYAPLFDRAIGTSFDKSHYLSDVSPTQGLDISWFEQVELSEKRSTKYITRAKNGRWPYYITILKNWSFESADGVVAVNINLAKLHDSLLAGRDSSMQVFLINEAQQIILMDNQEAPYTSISEIEELSSFIPEQNFSIIQTVDNTGYAYAQAYSEVYGFTCVTITSVGDYLVQILQLQKKIIIATSIAVLVVFLLSCVYSVKLVKPLQDIQNLLKHSINKETHCMKYDKNIQEIADGIISHMQTNLQLRKELDSRLQLLENTQMLALQAQINPHFLFNTLNSISLTIQSDCGSNHQGVKMIGALSAFLRYSLSASDTVSLSEELENTKRYMEIMQCRYEEVETTIEVDAQLLDCVIPKLTLQPLIENAMYHGLSASMGIRKGILKIQVREVLHRYPDGNYLDSVCIDIVDNGIGMDECHCEELRRSIAEHGKISKQHIGLDNVAHRLYLLFHSEQEIVIESTLGQGTCVRVLFPRLVVGQEKPKKD